MRVLFRMDLPVNSLFQAPTIDKLARYMIAQEVRPGLVEKTASVLKQVAGMSEEVVNEELRAKEKAGSKRS